MHFKELFDLAYQLYFDKSRGIAIDPDRESRLACAIGSLLKMYMDVGYREGIDEAMDRIIATVGPARISEKLRQMLFDQSYNTGATPEYAAQLVRDMAQRSSKVAARFWRDGLHIALVDYAWRCYRDPKINQIWRKNHYLGCVS